MKPYKKITSAARAAALAKQYKGDISRVATVMGVKEATVQWHLRRFHEIMRKRAAHARAALAFKRSQIALPITHDASPAQDAGLISRAIDIVREIDGFPGEVRTAIRNAIS